jgi:hypothetical protein
MKSISSAVACGLLAFSLLTLGQAPALAQGAPKAETKAATKTESTSPTAAASDKAAKPKRPLTAQQQKMKECGAKWQEEKKTKGVKGREAWNKFRSECLKKKS